MTPDQVRHTRIKSRRAEVLGVACLLAMSYAVVASIRYRIVHPDYTETQLLLHSGDILAWRE